MNLIIVAYKKNKCKLNLDFCFKSKCQLFNRDIDFIRPILEEFEDNV